MSNQEVVSSAKATVAFQGTQKLTVIVVAKRPTSDEALHLFKSCVRHKLITYTIATPVKKRVYTRLYSKKISSLPNSSCGSDTDIVS
jgi:hypothetical protein